MKRTKPTAPTILNRDGARTFLSAGGVVKGAKADRNVRAPNPPTITALPPNRARVPARWRKELRGVLISEDQLAQRVRQLARQLARDFAGRELLVVAVLNGTVLFLADLIRHLSLPLRLDFIGVSSYGPGTAAGELVFTKELRLDVRGRDVLLVDDILDTGRTLSRVIPKLRALKPRRIKVCVLLDKPVRRVEDIEVDYVGFEIPDFFVVGYGLDFAERYRNLPFVGVLHPHVYKQVCKRIVRPGKSR